MTDKNTETLGFQAEVQQLLHLMIHSLYSNKEIFLRELISNASDACDRLRFSAIAEPALLEEGSDFRIRVSFDKEAGTVTIADNGSGMSRDDVINNLGTIAKSGTAEFLSQLSGDERKDSALIGQFGVGFYSSFIVADRVDVFTRRAGLSASDGVHWQSDGNGEFTVEPAEIAERGTTIVLHLREDDLEFADNWRLRSLITRYSDHIAFPVEMPAEQPPAEEGEEAPAEPQFEAVNDAKALWTRPRTEVSDDEYKEFYKHIAHDFQDPVTWSHNRVEGKREYTSLLYVPARAPFDLWNREAPRGLKLYVQRVFIMDQADQFLPLYLRFIRGVVDTNDLSLNVSRELLQQDRNVEAIKSALTKRVLSMLEDMAKNDAETYQKVWDEFGRVLKEGPAEDFTNRERIAGLLRFASTHHGTEAQNVPLADYLERAGDDQDTIWYIAADNFAAAKSSPHLEYFKKQGIEVLLLTDPIDEWLLQQLNEFDGKAFRDVARGEQKAADADSEDDKEDEAGEKAALIERLSDVLGEQVESIRVTDRLVDSPACLTLSEADVGAQMRRLMEASGQTLPPSRPVFEINPEHPVVARLDAEGDDDRFTDLAHVLFDQAMLADGKVPADPGAFAQRLNRLLT